MPRKACDKVIEHRISLSGFEREQLKEVINSIQANNYATGAGSVMTGIGSIVGGIGFPLAALALGAWVGYSLLDNIDDTADTISTKYTSWLGRTGRVNYTADELGRMLTKTEAQEEQAGIDMLKYADRNQPTYDVVKAKATVRRMESLNKQTVLLRDMIARIASGDLEGYTISFALYPLREDAHKQMLTDLYLDQYEEMYGERPSGWTDSLNEGWEMETDDDPKPPEDDPETETDDDPWFSSIR